MENKNVLGYTGQRKRMGVYLAGSYKEVVVSEETFSEGFLLCKSTKELKTYT